MKMSARVRNSQGVHETFLRAGEASQAVAIPPKPTGLGSSVSGGELLFLALATCYCNDLYREAAKRKIELLSVDVEVEGDFLAEGAPAKDVWYRASVAANASEAEIRDLMQHTDTVAEIQNSLRVETPVRLREIGVEARK